MKLVVLGLSITSSWGNGHATTYRGLLREFARRGHEVLFVERDVPWYSENRDLARPNFCGLRLYSTLDELRSSDVLQEADLVVVGSYVPQGCEVAAWALERAACPVAFYDIDTPVTLAKLERGDYEYVSPELIKRFAAYFSFSGGLTLNRLEEEFGSPRARPLYCSFDPELYYPREDSQLYDIGYLGTYSDDRQPPLESLMLSAARLLPDRKFVVAGPQYPETIQWPANVDRIEHLPPQEHSAFYNSLRFTLNITRADMVRAGWSPSVRLFEAAACGIPVISDFWRGLDDFFKIGSEILVSEGAEQTRDYLTMSDSEARKIGAAARDRVMAEHTAAHRARELEEYALEILEKSGEPVSL